MRYALLLLAVTALVGCNGDPIGTACDATGDGFTRSDPCAEMCVEWAITCPDGREVTPGQCSGVVCGVDGACPEGQVCLQVDSFAENSRCMRATVCEAPPPS